MNESEAVDSAAPDEALERRAALAHLRHELRTPINAILGYSELLGEDAAARGESARLSDLEKIRAAGAQLLELVDALLDPHRLERSFRGIDDAERERRLRHDLRVPVNAVLGYAEMLMEDARAAGEESLLEDLGRIHTAGLRMIEVTHRVRRLSHPEQMAGDAVADPAGTRAVAAFRAVGRLRQEHLPPEPAPGPPGRVLVVDDSPVNRDLLSRRLAREGYRVSTVDGGEAALEWLRRTGCDLVLLDVMMPELSGYEVLRHLRSDAQLRHLPVIMISALDHVDSVASCIELGAEDYLPKPCDPVLLRARVGSTLERKRLRDREQAYLRELDRERELSERLLLNILPGPVALRLKAGEAAIADSLPEVTVLFADLCNFTEFAVRTAPAEVVRRLNDIFSAFDSLAERHGVEKIKTIGDAYMAAGGVPTPRSDHATAAAEMALDMVSGRREFGFDLRVGLHTGPVVAGIVGTSKFAYDLWGDTVNTAHRMQAHGLPGAIQVSEASYAHLAGEYRLEERGRIPIKGKGTMRTFLLRGRRG